MLGSSTPRPKRRAYIDRTKGRRRVKPDLTVIVLTYNEEQNVRQALDSVSGWASQVIVLDSFSTDETVGVAREFGCEVYQNPFEDFGNQRNHALQLPIRGKWILFLDADEWLPADLKEEITEAIAKDPAVSGYYLKRRLMWMGRWIRRGYYPTWILRLFRTGKGVCEDRGVNEHLVVDGALGYLTHDFIHEDHKGLSEWVEKHNHYAAREAQELLKRDDNVQQHEIHARLFGSQAERKRWLRRHIWERLPPLLRPFVYFAYRYVLCGGFLDGREAFIFHFLQGLWFPLLIDAKYLELRWQRAGAAPADGAECHVRNSRISG